MKDRYSVDEVCEQFGITGRTLHYYEEIGLLTDVPRTEGGHRYYNPLLMETLGHIIRLKDVMGISLQEIRTLMSLENKLEDIRKAYRQETDPAGRTTFLQEAEPLLEELVGKLNERMVQLQELRDGFEVRLKRVRDLRSQSGN